MLTNRSIRYFYLKIAAVEENSESSRCQKKAATPGKYKGVAPLYATNDGAAPHMVTTSLSQPHAKGLLEAMEDKRIINRLQMQYRYYPLLSSSIL